METFLFALYVIVTVGVLLLPSFIDISRGRMFALAVLPPILLALFFACWSLVRSLLVDSIGIDSINLMLFIAIFTIVFGTLMTLPIMLVSAFIVEYGRCRYRLNVMQRALLGASVGALLTGAVWQTWKFVWFAWISGFVAVWVQYYFTEYRVQL